MKSESYLHHDSTSHMTPKVMSLWWTNSLGFTPNSMVWSRSDVVALVQHLYLPEGGEQEVSNQSRRPNAPKKIREILPLITWQPIVAESVLLSHEYSPLYKAVVRRQKTILIIILENCREQTCIYKFKLQDGGGGEFKEKLYMYIIISRVHVRKTGPLPKMSGSSPGKWTSYINTIEEFW